MTACDIPRSRIHHWRRNRGTTVARASAAGAVEAILDRSGALMKRWKQRLLGMSLAVSGLIGCKHKLFISEKDYDHYRMLGLQMGGPADLDTNQAVTVAPSAYDVPVPKTVDAPNRQPRNISLEEALAIALEQGNTGSQSLQFPGISNENLQTGVTDSIRVLRLDPAVSGADRSRAGAIRRAVVIEPLVDQE